MAPHPDDESLCCGGVIERAREAGAQVSIVWLTSGDAFEFDAAWVEHSLHPGAMGMRALGARRMREARLAALRLGVPAQRQFFLGFPDRGLLPLLLDYVYVPYRSPYTGLSSVGYAGALQPGLAYEGANLERELEGLLDRLRPTYVLAPSPLDEHPDHHAAGSLVIRVLGARGELARARYWIVHGGADWPAPRGLHPDDALLAPRLAAGLAWRSVPLDRAERAAKMSALREYRTQMFGLERRFLLAFVRTNELFAKDPLPQNTRRAPVSNARSATMGAASPRSP